MKSSVVCKYKPSSSRRTQLIAAGSVWSIVGLCLLGFGAKWLLESETAWLAWLILGAIVIGFFKGHLVLRKSAKRTVNRIHDRGDGKCLFGAFSITSWLLVIVMMTMGRLLRSSGLPYEFIGAMYATIGIALLTGSSAFWLALKQKKQNQPTQGI